MANPTFDNPALLELGGALQRYLARAWPHLDDFSIVDVQQIPGGASRETYRVAARFREQGIAVERGFILRRDPPSSLIDTDRAWEYRTYAAVYPTDVPVPEPLILEEDAPGELLRPFSITAEIPGCETSIANFASEDYASLREHIGTQKWQILGRLAAMDPQQLGVTEFMPTPAPAECAQRELDYWAGVIETDALQPQPIAAAAIRWLRRQSPPPAQKLCLVHGDFRSGNFLYDRAGTIRGVLDWEMAHIGDPLEDLAWSLDPLWGWPEQRLAGGLLPRRRAIEIWSKASGLDCDAAAFRWWQVFASVKALAIWISSTEDFANGSTKEPILAMAGWVMTDRQNRILLDRLAPGSTHRYAEPLI
jgi:aminoglycoside phosphotransferase (APT) family kinase protein